MEQNKNKNELAEKIKSLQEKPLPEHIKEAVAKKSEEIKKPVKK